MIRYKTRRKPPWVIAVECEEAGYPHKDADGEVQFVNEHFDTAEWAWKHVLEATSLAQVIAVGDYEDAKDHLRTKKDKLAAVAATNTHAIEAFNEWRFSHKEPDEPSNPT